MKDFSGSFICLLNFKFLYNTHLLPRLFYCYWNPHSPFWVYSWLDFWIFCIFPSVLSSELLIWLYCHFQPYRFFIYLSLWLKNLVFCLFIHLAIWIRPYVPARKNRIENVNKCWGAKINVVLSHFILKKKIKKNKRRYVLRCCDVTEFDYFFMRQNF